MKRRLAFLIFVAILSIILVGCAKTEESADTGWGGEEAKAEQVELMISAAASLTNVSKELAVLYAETALM